LEDCSQAEIDEIRENLRTSKVYDLKIYGSGPTVHLDLCKGWILFSRCGLYLEDADNSTSLGLAQKITRVLPRCRLANFLGWKTFTLGVVGLPVWQILFGNSAWAKHEIGLAVRSVLGISAWALIFLSVFSDSLTGPALYLEKHSQRKSFFAAHGYELLKNTIVAIVAFILGLLGQLILKSLK
jgi:hypothetical protein